MIAYTLAAIAAGFCLAFAFAPYNLWPIAALSPACLIMLIERAEGRRAGLLGWCYGLGMFGYGVWWLQVSIHQFGVPYYAFSVTITALFVLGMALYPALFAYLYGRFRQAGVARLLWVPGLWLLLEYLRGWLFTGFPWLSLGYSQSDSPVGGFAPLLGVYGCSLVVMVQAVCIADLGDRARRNRIIAVGVLLFTVAAGAFLTRLNYGQTVEKDLQVALIQGAIPQELKWRRDVRDASIEVYQQLSAAHWDADLVIWPETAIAAFPHEVPDLHAALRRRVQNSRADLLIGMPTGKPWDGEYYNSVVSFAASEERYDKRHLVPFGEFFPFKDLISGFAMLLDIPLSDFSAGRPEQTTLHVAGHPAGISICYEDAFGRETLDALPSAAFLVNVSNDAWFGDTIAPHQHLQIARMRALETERYLLRATNTGITAVIDHKGRVVASARPFVATSLRATFQARTGSTPYVMTGDLPVMLLAGVMLLISFGRWRRRGGSIQSQQPSH